MSAMDERTEQETGFFDGNESYQVHSLVFCLFEQHVDPANVDTQTTHMADHGSGKLRATRMVSKNN